MDFIKSTLGRENDSGVDEPVEAEGGFLRDWVLPSTAFATENSSASWNPLSNLLGASSPVSAQDPLVLTTAERMRWRGCLGAGALALVLGFYLYIPEDDNTCGAFTILMALASCFLMGALLAHPARRSETFVKDKVPAILVVVLGVPSSLYAAFIKQSLSAAGFSAAAQLLAMVYLLLSSDPGTWTTAASCLSGMMTLTGGVLGAMLQCCKTMLNRT